LFDPDIVVLTDGDRTRYTTESYLRHLLLSGAPIPDPELREQLDAVGVLGAEIRDGVPVPFRWGRAAFERFTGRSARMPSEELVGRIRGLGEPVAGWAIREAARVSREMGAVPVMVGLNVVTPPPSEPMFTLVAAREAGMLALDLFRVFEGVDPDDLRVAPWDNHPNARGHQLIADRLYLELRRNAGLLAPSTQ
jgi:hypothetical protein